ncbi:hypothetical protein [Metabacillus halosaccharovorans]|uniref:hypothetical protein n=1 Tax=Metabacillus halosaccharovorans TaxID=930124 RepID=UPI000C7F921A|nr:hypothetical protein [Metabacillus halosaccharovorans]MBU7592852.1 hypothetical protein [Metabacillus halosaccharovorans]PMC36301.1 hypothetical protein CJ195_15970 [Bacillus sp. UMB0899]
MNSIDIIKKTVKQFRTTLAVFFLILIVSHYTYFNFSNEVVSAIVGTLFVLIFTGEFFLVKLIEKLKDKET